MKILVTGVAGFIGMHTALRLLERGDEVIGVDNLSDYYDIQLKKDRLAQLLPHDNFRFLKLDLSHTPSVNDLFSSEKFSEVIHLAAQPGVRYSIKNPHIYIQSNIVAFTNILEGCRHQQIKHLVYASSSSVYGANTKLPFSEEDSVDHPVSLYAATKKSNELMAHTYSHLFGLPTTGLRFFTVYGPWGRPDMSPSLFAHAILEGKSIDVFNEGNMQRDFTYVDDIVEGVIRVTAKPAATSTEFDPLSPSPAISTAPYRLYNIGNHEPVGLNTYIETLETALGKKAIKRLLPMQAGDVKTTYADIARLQEAVGFYPSTPLATGIGKFVDWFKHYYGFSS